MSCPPTFNARAVFSNWLVLLGLLALIFVQSHGLVLTNIPLPAHTDKLLHFVCFSVLAVCFFRAYHALPWRAPVKLIVLLSAVSAVLYGIGDELHQSFIPLRVADAYDLVADAAGALFGLGAYLLWRRRRGRPGSAAAGDRCRSRGSAR